MELKVPTALTCKVPFWAHVASSPSPLTRPYQAPGRGGMNFFTRTVRALSSACPSQRAAASRGRSARNPPGLFCGWWIVPAREAVKTCCERLRRRLTPWSGLRWCGRRLEQTAEEEGHGPVVVLRSFFSRQGRKSLSCRPVSRPSISAKCPSKLKRAKPCCSAVAAIQRSWVGTGRPLRRSSR